MQFAPIVAAVGFVIATASAALAGPAAVIDAKVKPDAKEVRGIYQFTVTVQHEDTGWDNYIDSWQIVAPDGSVLGTRINFKPQVGRNTVKTGLAGVVIPEAIKEVTIRAHNVTGGFDGEPLKVKIPH